MLTVVMDDIRRILPYCFAACLAGVGFTACGEMFDPYWQVDRYRILALRSDPVTLEPGDPAELTVLDHVPPDTSVSYDWSWCPVQPSAEQQYECPVEDIQEQNADGDGGGMSFDPELLDLGSGESASLLYPGTTDQVRELCRSIQEAIAEAGQSSNLAGRLPTPNCSRGYDISVRLEATTDDGTVEVAKKDVTLSTGGDQTNQNPDHGGLEIRVADPGDLPKVRDRLDWLPPAGTARDEQWVDASGDEPLPILTGMTFQVRARVDEESSEEYRPPPPAGSDREQLPPEREGISFRWFATQGELEQSQRIYVPENDNLETARRTGVTISGDRGGACAEDPQRDACRVTVYSVIRDGRLGSDFARANLRIEGVVSP